MRRNRVKTSRSLEREPRSLGWVRLAVGLLLGVLVACSNSSASTASSERVAATSAALTPSAESVKSQVAPQQVVQRMEPVPPGATGAAKSAPASGGAAATPEQTSTGSRPAAITSRHLEAELNRLEDELRR